MGDFDEIKITKDDEKAIRVCSLYIKFVNAKAFLTTAEIRSEFYPGAKDDAFTKAFERDREALAKSGLRIVKAGSTPEGNLWKVDTKNSFISKMALDSSEALNLVFLCQSFLADPGFAYANELRFALAKISLQFNDLSNAPKEPQSKLTKTSEKLRECFENRHAAKVKYVNSKGEVHDYYLAPYGFYTKHGKAYMVAAILNDGDKGPGTGRASESLTFIIDSVLKTNEEKTISYQIPDDFDIVKHKKLPFQMGKPIAQARFFVPFSQEHEVRAEAYQQGTWKTLNNGMEWTVPTNNLDTAASWAIAYAIKPLGPSELVNYWKMKLREVACHG